MARLIDADALTDLLDVDYRRKMNLMPTLRCKDGWVIPNEDI